VESLKEIGVKQPERAIATARLKGRADLGDDMALHYPPRQGSIEGEIFLLTTATNSLMVAFAQGKEGAETKIIVRVAAPRGLRYERLAEGQQQCRSCHSAAPPQFPEARDLWGRGQ
jgi:hypothetical protein